ncbi:hypothetical protein C900_00802 [Fulvivirga imtechensis AK7]|uniref:TonB-dependent receptor plug domain-containing protein n=1 Tax=Fulvivirga imtechensis AK7 TaxID=1237149 RepID=L8JV13_9BACT|nr:TonB-dependent receptor [Fulvivirga imtechensis]ELR72841.1 hypothetical protein C900_00802 [Fulvivirga imtechensis AK7]
MIPQVNFSTNLFLATLSIGLLLTGQLQAQHECEKDCSCSISGLVVDVSTGEPIPYATIQVSNGNQKGGLTDQNGRFLIDGLCHAEYDITISHVGYKSVIHHHDIYHPNLEVKMATNEMILESIIVEGEAMETGLESLSISKLSGKDLDRLKTEKLGEALANITGVSTLKTGQNIVKPVIHGLHSNRVLIINNGIRHESQSWGQEHAPEIDPAMADNISLVKGAAAVKYGPDAMGGVIIINPPKMELSTGHLHGEAGITSASNGRSLNADLLLQEGYKNFAWMAQVSGLYQGDLSAPDYLLTNTGARELSYMLGGHYHKRNLDINIYYSHVRQRLGILRGSVVGNLNDLQLAVDADEPFYTRSFSYDINTPYQEVSHDLIKAEGSYILPTSKINFQYGFQVNKRQEFDVRRGANNERPSIDLELMTHSLDIDWLHPELGDWSGKIGGQMLYQDNNNIPGTNTIPFVPNYNNSRVGVYVVESKYFRALHFEAGLRYDYQSTSARGRNTNNDIYSNNFSYHSLTGLVGISTPWGRHTNLQMNIGSAWRPPNIAELYSFGKHEYTIEYGLWRSEIDELGRPVSSDVVYSQDTKPVDNELGFKWITTVNRSMGKSSLEASVYANYLKNYIFTKPGGVTSTVRGPFPYYVYLQTDAFFYGLDASVIMQHPNRWKSRITGSYLNARDIENDDYFVGIPSNRLSYEISHQKKIFGLEFDGSIETRYVFRQYNAPRTISIQEIIYADASNINLFEADDSSFDFLDAPNGYLLLNTHLDITIRQLVLGIQVNNILNASYREYTNLLRYFADEPGINFKFSARYKF